MFIALRSKASTRLMVPLPIGLTARFSLGLFSRTMRWSSRDCNLAMNSRCRGEVMFFTSINSIQLFAKLTLHNLVREQEAIGIIPERVIAIIPES